MFCVVQPLFFARNLRLRFVYVLIRLSSIGINSLAQFNQIKRKLIKEEKRKSYSLVTKIKNWKKRIGNKYYRHYSDIIQTLFSLLDLWIM